MTAFPDRLRTRSFVGIREDQFPIWCSPGMRTNEAAQLEMQIQRAAWSLQQGVQDLTKPGPGHEQKRQDMVGKHSCPQSLNEK